MRKTMTLPTYDWGQEAQGRLDRNPKDIKYEMPFSETDPNGQHYGMPVTKKALEGMVAAYAARRQEEDQTIDIAYVTFSKASILRILSQERCEKIRFYFAFPEPDELSLTLEGVDINDKALDFQKVEPNSVFIEEKGNGGGGTVQLQLMSKVYNTFSAAESFAQKSADEIAKILLEKVNS